jgi:hypothetical protein
MDVKANLDSGFMSCALHWLMDARICSGRSSNVDSNVPVAPVVKSWIDVIKWKVMVTHYLQWIVTPWIEPPRPCWMKIGWIMWLQFNPIDSKIFSLSSAQNSRNLANGVLYSTMVTWLSCVLLESRSGYRKEDGFNQFPSISGREVPHSKNPFFWPLQVDLLCLRQIQEGWQVHPRWSWLPNDFMLSLLQNVFNCYLSLNRAVPVDADFKEMCLELADDLFRFVDNLL